VAKAAANEQAQAVAAEAAAEQAAAQAALAAELEGSKPTSTWLPRLVAISLACLAIVAASVFFYQQANAPAQAITTLPLHATATHAGKQAIVVYVTGAVSAPGVYRLWDDARIGDLVGKAGGLLPAADPVAINLAARLEDGEQVNVPFKATAAPAAPLTVIGKAASQPSGTAAAVAAKSPTPGKVNLNSASEAELDAGLPGVGPVLAKNIVAYRTANGHFRSVDDLRKVDGIHKSLFDKLKLLVTV